MRRLSKRKRPAVRRRALPVAHTDVTIGAPLPATIRAGNQAILAWWRVYRLRLLRSGLAT